jgi:small conductance mechanosensitive channel
MSFLSFFIQAQQADSLPTIDLQKSIHNLLTTPFDQLLQHYTSVLVSFGVKVVICFVLFWAGKKAISFLYKFLRRVMDRREVDPTVSHFLTNLLRVLFWIVLVWILISILGINTASIVAMFASAGLAFGLALSGTLQNFAGGVMILIFKPFRVGDYIYSQGEEGTVSDITIINTMLTTPDNRAIFLPNGATFTGIVRNTNRMETRRVEWTFGIGYGDSYDRAKKLLFELIARDSRILPTPEPFVALKNLGESSVDIVVRVWVKSSDYWGVLYDLNEQVYKAFPANNLDIPFPQMDVYVHNPEAAPASPAPTDKPTVLPPAPEKQMPVHCENRCDDSAKPAGGED